MITKDYFEKHPQFYIWYARPGYATPGRECYLWQYDSDIGLEYGVDEPLDKNGLLGEDVANVSLDTESESYGKLEEELVDVRCELETGRTHQIRVQFSSRKTPLTGDGRYGSKVRDCSIALHSHKIVFNHPRTKEQVEFVSNPDFNIYPWNIGSVENA